jgi:hypothetical protein
MVKYDPDPFHQFLPLISPSYEHEGFLLRMGRSSLLPGAKTGRSVCQGNSRARPFSGLR